MKATVTSIDQGHVRARVRRNRSSEGVMGTAVQLDQLRVGDRIEVRRVPNNPYLILCDVDGERDGSHTAFAANA